MKRRRLRDIWHACAMAAAIGAPAGTARAANPQAAECVAASNAAIRSDNDHHYRQERVELLSCAAAGCPADIRKECIRRVDEITAAIPTIMFEAKDAAGNDLSAVKVTMDREILTERLDGIATAVDPGPHTFTFESPGFLAVQKRYIIRERQRDRLERVTFEANNAGAVASVAPSASSASTSVTSAEEPSRSSANKTLAILATGVGVAGVAVGTIFGMRALSQRDDANQVCSDACATPAGVDMWRDAKSTGNISTIAFVIGGVGLATAAVLWVAGKPEAPAAPSAQVGLSLGGMAVRGRW
jgi:hypothetical protein